MADALPNSAITEKIASLARAVFGLSDDEGMAFNRAVSLLRAEKANADAQRIATLRTMTDRDLAQEVLWECVGQGSDTYPDRALQMLREGGFVRHAGIEAAYRVGFEASSEGWNGEHPGDAAEQPRFALAMQEALETIRDRIEGDA
ncbi:hypothetical protein [Methylobacterium brachiatum]|uniref:hypothetical protein n=1 Tax=Methylobacterium brachiatum TaxID=269660 RepID=UPI0003FE57AD|nr:hypothetical protein [Methylobacterium brachiatum]SFI80428.1 hypothetical protein SAMN02799642_02827 [Methylobacterium brachiatum]